MAVRVSVRTMTNPQITCEMNQLTSNVKNIDAMARRYQDDYHSGRLPYNYYMRYMANLRKERDASVRRYNALMAEWNKRCYGR